MRRNQTPTAGNVTTWTVLLAGTVVATQAGYVGLPPVTGKDGK